MSNLWTIPDFKEELSHLAALHQKRPGSPVVQGMAATWCGKVANTTTTTTTTTPATTTTTTPTPTPTATATATATATTAANSSNNNDNDHDIYNTVDELTPPPRSLFPRVASPTPPIPGAWLQYGQPLGQPSALRKVLGEATVIAGLAMKNDQNS